MSRAAEAHALLARVATEHAPAAFSSSLGAEDMVVTDLIARTRLPIEIFTLETGRLHRETRELIARVQDHYNIALTVMHPDAAAVADYVARHGRDAIYQSVALRKRCCEIRKLEPLARALAGKRAWVTGLRRAQSAGRAGVPLAGYDETYRLAKFNPLADWSEAEVWDYIRAHDVPYNPLHDRGFPSIGCEPCTRAVRAGEDPRAGRWWWEEGGGKECGLHAPANAKSGLAFRIHLGFSGGENHSAGKAETMENPARDHGGLGTA